MIMVRLTMNVLPGKHLEVMQTLVSMIEPTGKESGCLSYSVLRDVEDESLYTVLEAWESRENLDHHIRSYRFGVVLGIKTLLCEPMIIQIHTVSHSEGAKAVQIIRGSNN
jgi:quinol monooxygenase YgiN